MTWHILVHWRLCVASFLCLRCCQLLITRDYLQSLAWIANSLPSNFNYYLGTTRIKHASQQIGLIQVPQSGLRLITMHLHVSTLPIQRKPIKRQRDGIPPTHTRLLGESTRTSMCFAYRRGSYFTKDIPTCQAPSLDPDAIQRLTRPSYVLRISRYSPLQLCATTLYSSSW